MVDSMFKDKKNKFTYTTTTKKKKPSIFKLHHAMKEIWQLFGK